MATQRHDIEAWLGDDHGLTDDQIARLVTTADDIADRYPEPQDDRDDREAALTVAYRLMTGDPEVVDELARELATARQAERRALVGLRQAALDLIPAGTETQAGFARRAGVDRMAVRGWLGRR